MFELYQYSISHAKHVAANEPNKMAQNGDVDSDREAEQEPKSVSQCTMIHRN